MTEKVPSKSRKNMYMTIRVHWRALILLGSAPSDEIWTSSGKARPGAGQNDIGKMFMGWEARWAKSGVPMEVN